MPASAEIKKYYRHELARQSGRPGGRAAQSNVMQWKLD
jgi:hypothetical protein